ncbi:MAG TPA: YafY family protein [Devosiaceae bacterium]
MSRTERLFDLLQILRRHRIPVTGGALASELGVSLRTLYRDIATLQAQGAEIIGEPGLGYVLKPGFMLPPLMFSEDEIEALVLGSRWVSDRGDQRLAAAAANALAKIGAVLPRDLREQVDGTGLMLAGGDIVRDRIDLGEMRQAIRRERKARITYLSLEGVETERTVWPFAIGFFEKVRVLTAWCEMREDFRNFRTDRIVTATYMPERYPQRRQALLKEWAARMALRGQPDAARS